MMMTEKVAATPETLESVKQMIFGLIDEVKKKQERIGEELDAISDIKDRIETAVNSLEIIDTDLGDMIGYLENACDEADNAIRRIEDAKEAMQE